MHGRVQGVGFRAFVRHGARDAGISTGYARNCPDGTVEVEAEGSAEALARLAEHLRRGPSWSRVSRVELLEPGTAPLPDPFERG